MKCNKPRTQNMLSFACLPIISVFLKLIMYVGEHYNIITNLLAGHQQQKTQITYFLLTIFTQNSTYHGYVVSDIIIEFIWITMNNRNNINNIHHDTIASNHNNNKLLEAQPPATLC
eukprot:526559_1